MGYPGSSWYPKPGSYKAIMDAIAPFTYLHMPAAHRVETRSILIKTESLPSQRKLLTELKETAAIEGAFELKNMANIVTKAQQISDGWLKADDGNVKHFESGKVNRLEALVEELLQTEYKMVVWCAFREDINRLAHLTDLFKVKVATLQSGEVFDSTLWQRASCRICLATEASGSSVNHFAQVPYAIYFSQDFKWHSLQQSAGRHTRRSSLHSVAYNIFLHSDKPSLDAQVYWTVRKSMHSEKSFIQALDVKQWIESK